MIRIGLISDTHNFLDSTVFEYFKDVDEIWHIGDFGTISIADQLKTIAPVVGVYGNIDGWDIRHEYPLIQDFVREGLRIVMTHIGGSLGRYALTIRKELEINPPDIFLCGHSHILKVGRDKALKNMIFINPGAAGKQGFHTERTIIRFAIDNGKVLDMQVINLGPKSDQEDIL